MNKDLDDLDNELVGHDRSEILIPLALGDKLAPPPYTGISYTNVDDNPEIILNINGEGNASRQHEHDNSLVFGITNKKHKLTEEDVFEIRKLLAADVPQVDIAAKFNVKASTISSIKIGKTWRSVVEEEDDHISIYMAAELDNRIDFIERNEEYLKTLPDGEEVVEKAKIQWRKDKDAFDGKEFSRTYLDEFGQWETVSARKLQAKIVGEEEVTPEPVYLPAIIGQDIIDIRALTGKREKQAKEALQAATVEMLSKASPDCLYIRGNTASSKNSKEIGFYWKKQINPHTNEEENVKVNILVDSKVTQAYRKSTAGYWLQNKVSFLNQVRGLPLPVSIEFTFIRDSMRRSDFINMAQIVCDLMVENGWIPDDDTVHIVPVFNPVVFYHKELAGVLIRVIK